MNKRNLFLILCISLLLSGCQKTLESPSAARSETAPWEAESQDAQSSYNDLTQETRPQESRKIYGEEDGADWRKTAEVHTERLGFSGANIGQGGLMAGDGEWVYYRSETDWGLYKARTDGSEQAQLLPAEDYAPSSINVLGGWVFSLACAHGWK